MSLAVVDLQAGRAGEAQAGFVHHEYYIGKPSNAGGQTFVVTFTAG